MNGVASPHIQGVQIIIRVVFFWGRRGVAAGLWPPAACSSRLRCRTSQSYGRRQAFSCLTAYHIHLRGGMLVSSRVVPATIWPQSLMGVFDRACHWIRASRKRGLTPFWFSNCVCFGAVVPQPTASIGSCSGISYISALHIHHLALATNNVILSALKAQHMHLYSCDLGDTGAILWGSNAFGWAAML
jgi:hypothetical protein